MWDSTAENVLNLPKGGAVWSTADPVTRTFVLHCNSYSGKVDARVEILSKSRLWQTDLVKFKLKFFIMIFMASYMRTRICPRFSSSVPLSNSHWVSEMIHVTIPTSEYPSYGIHFLGHLAPARFVCTVRQLKTSTEWSLSDPSHVRTKVLLYWSVVRCLGRSETPAANSGVQTTETKAGPKAILMSVPEVKQDRQWTFHFWELYWLFQSR